MPSPRRRSSPASSTTLAIRDARRGTTYSVYSSRPRRNDTAVGNKENEKFYNIYGIENRGVRGPTALEDGLLDVGVRPEDIALVINSHLHFDHAGGNMVRETDGRLRPAFVNARYVV